MIDWKEVEKVEQHFNVPGLIEDIANIAEAIKEAYDRERELSRDLRPIQAEMADLDVEFTSQAAADGKNESQRKAILAQLRAESIEYGELSEKAEKAEDEVKMYRDLRAHQKEALNARRSVSYLIGSVLDACKAYRYYSDAKPEAEPEPEPQPEIEIPF